MGSRLSEGSQGLSTGEAPGPAASSVRTTPGRPTVTGAWSLDTGASRSPVPSRPQAWRPSLCPEGQQQAWGQTGRGGSPDPTPNPPTPPPPLCSSAPSPVPTLRAPGVTQAQRLREEGPHPVQAGTWGHWLPRPQEGPVTGLQGRGADGPSVPPDSGCQPGCRVIGKLSTAPRGGTQVGPTDRPRPPHSLQGHLLDDSSPSGNAPGPLEPSLGPSTWLLGDLGTWTPMARAPAPGGPLLYEGPMAGMTATPTPLH